MHLFHGLLLCGVIGHETVLFAMDGSSQGIFGKGWALLGLTAVPGSEKSVDEALRQQAMAALNGFIYFAPVVPHKMSFLGRVMEATNTYFNGTLETPSEVSPYAANLYDAIVLYATTLARINPSINALDGDFVAAMKETRFDGMSGMVSLDEHGDIDCCNELRTPRRQNGQR